MIEDRPCSYVICTVIRKKCLVSTQYKQAVVNLPSCYTQFGSRSMTRLTRVVEMRTHQGWQLIKLVKEVSGTGFCTGKGAIKLTVRRILVKLAILTLLLTANGRIKKGEELDSRTNE